MQVENRTDKYGRDTRLEDVLKEVNGVLEPVEQSIMRQFKNMQLPSVMLVGCPRSGSTLFMQWLANTALFAYPTNLLSRFYAAPYLGARIQQMLVDFDFKDEIFEKKVISYESDLGKTNGPLAPHEFWYFWRRFFQFEEYEQLTPAQLNSFKSKTLQAELAALESAYNKPLVLKAMLMNWHIGLLHQLFPKTIFVHVKRNPIRNIKSILTAREKMYGNRNTWWSFRPPNYKQLLHLSPEEQVAVQVYSVSQTVEEQLVKLPSENQLTINYQDFCKQPKQFFQQLIEQLNSLGAELPSNYKGVHNFNTADNNALHPDEIIQLKEAFDKAPALLNAIKH